MDTSFRESSPGWLISKLLRRSWEGVEYWLSQIDWPDSPELPEWSLPQWLLDFFRFFALLTTSQVVGLILLMLGGALLGWAWWTWGRRDRPISPTTALEPETSHKLSGSAASWLEKARQAQQAQRYGQACQALYCAMLLKLDEAQLVPQQPSRTDGEYRYLTQDLPQPTAPQLLLETHERLCFGSAPASQPLFDQCLQAYEQLEQQVDQLLEQQRVAQALAREEAKQRPAASGVSNSGGAS